MKKKIIAFSMLFFMSIFILTACKKKEKIKIGSGVEGGNYYSYANTLKKQIEEDSKISVEVKTTAGSEANLRLLEEGFVDVALVQADAYNSAINGLNSFSDNKLTNIYNVATLYTESVQIIVPAGSSIYTVSDLENKKISIGLDGSGTMNNALDVLKAYNITNYTKSNLSFSNSADALEKGEIDAFFMTSSFPTETLVELSKKYSFRFVSIDSVAFLSSGIYEKSIIKAGTYPGQTLDIETIGVACYLVANKKVDENVVKNVVDIIENHNSDIISNSFGNNTVIEKSKTRATLKIDMYLTLAIAVIALYLGKFLRKKIKFLEKFCIPAPVIGGLVFAIVSCIFYATGLVEFKFDETLKSVCMIIFFTSVGFQADLKILKKGGIGLVLFLLCVVLLIVFQNAIAVGVAKLLGVSSFMGLSTGSISMVGGHGTAGAFGTVLEDLGEVGATTLCTTAATFGLIMGSLMGGPVGRRLILKHDLTKKMKEEDDTLLIEEDVKHKRAGKYAQAAYMLAIAMGIGTLVSYLLSLTGMTFPVYIGAMIVAAIMRNVSEFSGKFEIHMGEINDLGGICLSLFLGIAMVTLKLWQLADCALPLLVLLIAQSIFMFIFAYFVVFNIMGRNYDAAILAAGTCGFGMGATPNAMANMQSLTEKYGPSIQAFILVPIVGSMFADFINSLVITGFINFL